MFGRKRTESDVVMRCGPGAGDVLGLNAHCFQNVFITGQVGSSKTTGVGAILALGLLGHPSRPGGLVLCQKPDEAVRWLRYAEQAGRLKDVIHVRLGGRYKLDILDYALRHWGPEEAALLLEVVLEFANRNKSRNSADSYWPESSGRQMRAAMTIIPKAGLVCGLEQVLQFCKSLPNSPEQLKDLNWARSSYAVTTTLAAGEKHDGDRDYELATDFVAEEWPNLSDKTRSIIQSVTVNTLERFLAGKFRDLISGGETTFTPEMAIADGRLILLDVPGSVHGMAAQMAAVAVKLLHQRTVLRRDLAKPCRPCFQWADEAANFCVPAQDAMFLSQSRQFKCACVNIIQNFPLAYTALGGGDVARQNCHAWLSNHATHFVAAQSDHETASFYSALCGERHETFFGGSSGESEPYDPLGDWMGAWRANANVNWSTQVRPAMPPYEFATLASGGKANGFVMEAVVIASGRLWSNGRTWMRSAFRQRL